MKKLTALVMVLLLSFACALADIENDNLTIEAGGTWGGDIRGFVHSIAATEDALYLLNNELELLSWDKSTGDVSSAKLDNHLLCLISKEGTLYGVERLSGLLAPIVINDGKATLQDGVVLDYSGFDFDERWGVSFEVYDAFFAEDYLYMRISASWSNGMLYRFDLQTGTAEKIYGGSDLRGVCAYKDGKLLAIQEQSELSTTPPRLRIFDPDRKAFGEALFDIDTRSACGLCYAPAEDTLYFSGADGVMYQKGNAAAKRLCYLPVSRFSNETRAALIGQTHYALQMHDSVVIRPLTMAEHRAKEVVVAGSQLEYTVPQGYRAFMKNYPEVLFSNPSDIYFSSAEDVFQDMLSDAAYDVYAVHYDIAQALVAKGYCVDLSGSAAVLEVVQQMPPRITAPFMKDGAVFALPYQAYLSDVLAYSPSLLEEMGLTEADLPTDLSGFMDFLVDWYEVYGPNNPHLGLVYNQRVTWREQLVAMIFQQQLYYCIDRGIPATVDTPQVKALLDKVTALDAVLKQIDDQASISNRNRFSNAADPPTALFNIDFSTYGFDDNHVNNQDYTPFPMNYYEDIPYFNALTLSMFIINPNSKNRDVALQFLEEIALNTPPGFKATTFTGPSEPVENPNYARDTADSAAYLEMLKRSYEKAADFEKKDLEALIADVQKMLDWQEESRFAITSAQIDMFRALAHTYMPAGHTYYLFNHSQNLQSVFDRYIDGQIGTERYIQETEQILKRMQSERE